MRSDTTTDATPAPFKVRRISFDYPADDMPRHFTGDDLVMTHVVATLSAVFPEGEDYFVRSVRNYRDKITDPVLKGQVAAFIGQEAIHGREHRVINDRLDELGYPSKRIDRFIGNRLRFDERIAPERFRLATTAALEHYTATLAEVLLEKADARAKFTSDEVRNLLLWHAVEESEHKAVAFDVYQQVCGDQKLRARIMNATTVGFIVTTVIWTTISMLKDPVVRRNPRQVLRNLANLRTSPWLTKEVRSRIRDYNRPDFHPDDHDSSALLAEWRERLFGEDGSLTDHLATAS